MHASRNKESGGIVVGNQGGRRDFDMAAVDKKLDKFGFKFTGLHGKIIAKLDGWFLSYNGVCQNVIV